MNYIATSWTTQQIIGKWYYVAVGGPKAKMVIRHGRNLVWRDSKTGKSLGRMSIEKMRKKLSY